ncbi:hypothetical protein JCM11491_000360 [Sporobolomyces phaffii]
MRVRAALVALFGARLASGYIPAVPTNDSTSFNSDSDDVLHLAYYNGPFSVFTADVSRQLLAAAFGDDGNYTNSTTIVPSTRYSKGVLLHFDETLRTQPPAAVPWLAMVNCDTNGTSFSDVDDIFTICRDLGAQAAVLYSLTAQGCAINPEYIDKFEKVLDVYATTSLQNARIIESQFGNVNSSAWKYDSEALNASATLIEALLANNALSVVGNVPINMTTTTTGDGDLDDFSSTMTTDLDAPLSASSFFPSEVSVVTTDSSSLEPSPSTTATTGARFVRKKRQQAQPGDATGTSSSAASRASSSSAPRTSSSSSATPRTATTTRTSSSLPTVAINYLGAVVAARNLTVGGTNTSGAAPTPSSNSNRNDGGPNTGLAMIILYSITGVVTFLFFTVIVCGAVRAIRYPERYGPRAGFGYRHTAAANGTTRGGGGGGPDGDGGGGQNRAQGLARAVLDTFPIVRFGGGTAAARRGEDDEEGRGAKRAESPKDVDDVELVDLAPTLSAVPPPPPTPHRRRTASSASDSATWIGMLNDEGGRPEVEEIENRRQDRPSREGEVVVDRLRPSVSINSFHSAMTGSLVPAAAAVPAVVVAGGPGALSSEEVEDPSDPSLGVVSVVDPAATPGTGHDEQDGDNEEEEEQLSCPICVCEFAAGDPIRILPCDARHQFHVECIDPWLLGVSRLCPLCRLDLGGGGGGGGGDSDRGGPGGRRGSSSRQQPPRAVEDAADDDRAAREERERHEEERVVRHLRELLARGSTSTSLGGGGGGRIEPGRTNGADGQQQSTSTRTRTTTSDSQSLGDSLDLVAAAAASSRDTVGLKSRFAKYVAAKRRRTTAGGGGRSPPTELAATAL